MSEKTQIRFEPKQPTITLERVFDAPRRLVFKAWTDPDHVKRWYDLQGYTLSDCNIDFRVGGRWRVDLQSSNGQDYGVSGEYREIIPPERVVQVFHYDGAPNAEATETLDFVEKDGQTTLTSTVVHASVENRDRHIRLGVEQAAHQILDRLATHLRSPDEQALSAINNDQVPFPDPLVPEAAAPRSKKDGRVWVGALALSLLLGGAFYWFWSRGAEPNYLTETVDRGPVVRTISADGLVTSDPSTPVRASVSGKIASLHCDPGDRVRAGQLCARIEPRPFQTAVAREKAALAAAQSRFKKAKAEFDRAKAALERSQASGRRGAISEAALSRAGSDYEEAKARVQDEQDAIARGQASVSAAERELASTNIASPLDGTVLARNVEAGQMVGTISEPPLFIFAPEPAIARIDARVSAEEADGIKVGDEASFTVEGGPDRVFSGKVKEINHSSQTGSSAPPNIVVISASDVDPSIKPGMRATIQIIKDRRDNAIRAPNRALIYAASRRDTQNNSRETSPPGWTRLWVLRDGKATAVNVRLGVRDGAYTEIIGGDLHVGDQLIVG